MGIGLSVLLLAAGAILAFAVNATVSGIDIHVVGWILMAAGAIGLIWSLVLVSARRQTVAVEPRPTVVEPRHEAVVAREVPVEREVPVQDVRRDAL